MMRRCFLLRHAAALLVLHGAGIGAAHGQATESAAVVAPKSTAAPSCAPPSFVPGQLGSYNRANLALMAEDSEDLCSGRPLSPADAQGVLRRHDQVRAAAPAPAAAPQSMSGMR